MTTWAGFQHGPLMSSSNFVCCYEKRISIDGESQPSAVKMPPNQLCRSCRQICSPSREFLILFRIRNGHTNPRLSRRFKPYVLDAISNPQQRRLASRSEDGTISAIRSREPSVVRASTQSLSRTRSTTAKSIWR